MAGGRLADIVRRLKPSAERFGAAAALYWPDVMLQLAATSVASDGRSAPACERDRGNCSVPALACASVLSSEVEAFATLLSSG